MGAYQPVPLTDFPAFSEAERRQRVTEFRTFMERRRTIRFFSGQPVPKDIIAEAVKAANTAPSGANKQPWHFAIVSDPAVKKKIREAAEIEEKEFYESRAGEEWLKDLAHLGTDSSKPFLETAPYLIVCFQQNYALDPKTGKRSKHYYVQESAGLATGFLIAALHIAGLATLTHTPSPMGFLRDLLGRPKNERAIMIVVAGHPAEDAMVPTLTKKDFSETCSWF